MKKIPKAVDIGINTASPLSPKHSHRMLELREKQLTANSSALTVTVEEGKN